MGPVRDFVLTGGGTDISNPAERKGIIFVVSGPSGCGKTTLCRRLLRNKPGLVNSISATTRLPRKGERRDIDYTYISEKEFKARAKRKEFLEYARVFDSYYGTPKKRAIDTLKKGKDLLLCIDIQGAAQIKRAFKNAVFIFILPPAFADLKKRLLKRSSDNSAQIRRRLGIARREMLAINMYDYAVINDEMEKAAGTLTAIVTAERNRIRE